MSYRENQAWLAIAAIALTLVPYFVWVSLAQPETEGARLLALGMALGGEALLLGATRLWLRARTPSQDRVRDERDREIERRAVGAAYGTLMAGTIVVGVVLPFDRSGWDLINPAVAAIGLAQGVQGAVVIWNYRYGS
ncbi:MAG: hypothetical protein ACK4E3_06865 [Brevundimonas sp.]|uniref:hypothetical protein n=1 Tax=Brevundimonas sp. TaxID=1871086 RepID=UPI00391CB8AF